MMTLDLRWWYLITQSYFIIILWQLTIHDDTWSCLLLLWQSLITLDDTWSHMTLDYRWWHLITYDDTWSQMTPYYKLLHLIIYGDTWSIMMTLDLIWWYPIRRWCHFVTDDVTLSQIMTLTWSQMLSWHLILFDHCMITPDTI